MVGEVSVTALGEMRVHPISMKICTIPGQGLMNALEVTLSKRLDLHEAKGVRVEGNDLLIDPAKLLPPPVIRGHLVHVTLENGSLMEYFGGAANRVAGPMVEPDS